MSTTQVSAPVALAVSLDDIAATLRLDADALDAIGPTLALTVRAITQEAEHKTQRSFINRGMRATLDAFPEAIRIERGPVFAVTALNFRDAAGMMQQLDPQDFEVDNATVPGWLVPAVSKAWPETMVRINAVTVDYTAGYGVSADDVPECARQYILLRLADLWDPANRKFGETAASVFADSLLDQLRVYA
ncbi:head-tail connector protein [Massilia sp. DWR3-1-1]|uniref:head-tail connector protein n=1 Tax=Massilia sp. DWR3-1-1 TaxID=2804559 RepID=UPI003CF2D273